MKFSLFDKAMLLAGLLSFGGVFGSEYAKEKENLLHDIEVIEKMLVKIGACIVPNPNWHQKDDGDSNRTLDRCTDSEKAEKERLTKLLAARNNRLKKIVELQGQELVDAIQKDLSSGLRWKE